MLKRLSLIISLFGTQVFADPAVVRDVTYTKSGALWTFNVTLSHDDTGWDDYANAWRISTPDGTVIGTRKLAHPHVNEQPFTRSLSGVKVPDGVRELRFEASESVGGWTSESYMLKLR